MLIMQRPAPPSDDKRWRLVDATMRRSGYNPSALIETLHTAQETFGYLADDAMTFIARSLRVPLSKAYGVASFYHHFNFKPAGRHTCVVCTGTACYIKGAPELLAAIKDKFGVEDGETSADGGLSILTARCVGSCGLAPLAFLDGNAAPKVGAGDLVKSIEGALSHDHD